MPNFDEKEILDDALEEVVKTDSEGNLSPTVALIKQGNDLSDKIVKATSTELNDLKELFKENMLKKNIIRANRLSGLLDLVDTEVITRFSATPEDFENRDLLQYMTQTQQAIQNIENDIEKTPLIQINNQTNEVNINTGLDSESRAKVLKAVDSIIKDLKSNNEIIDVDIDKKEGE